MLVNKIIVAVSGSLSLQLVRVVSGKFIDEGGKPLENVQLQYYRVNQRGFSAISTFDLTTKTDKNGDYSFSQIAPNGTDHLEILAEQPDSMSAYEYLIYLKFQESIFPRVRLIEFLRIKWGKFTIINYQIRKQ